VCNLHGLVSIYSCMTVYILWCVDVWMCERGGVAVEASCSGDVLNVSLSFRSSSPSFR